VFGSAGGTLLPGDAEPAGGLILQDLEVLLWLLRGLLGKRGLLDQIQGLPDIMDDNNNNNNAVVLLIIMLRN